jgi:hypothetical protein
MPAQLSLKHRCGPYCPNGHVDRSYTGAVLSPRILVVGGLALCGWCGWVSGFHTDTPAAVATWCVSVGFVAGVDLILWSRGPRKDTKGSELSPAEPWPRPGRGGPGPAVHGLSPWLILIAVAAIWDVLGIDTGVHQAHLTISALAQAFRPVNAALLLVWMLVGMGYGLARARAPHRGRSAKPAGPHMFVASMVPSRGHPEMPALLLPSSRPVGLLFWGATCMAGIVIDQAARRSRGRFATSGDFVRFTSTALPARILLIAAWTFAGFHLFAR